MRQLGAIQKFKLKEPGISKEFRKKTFIVGGIKKQDFLKLFAFSTPPSLMVRI